MGKHSDSYGAYHNCVQCGFVREIIVHLPITRLTPEQLKGKVGRPRKADQTAALALLAGF